MKSRRQFLIALPAALAATHPAFAQEKIRRVAWFASGRAGVASPFLSALRAGMRELGWIDGRNVAITELWTEGTPADEERLARVMLASGPELVITQGRNVVAVHRAQPRMPVVFAFSGNPVDAGVVQSFARPGGNMTGVSLMSLDLAGKRIELLKEIAPQIRRMGVLTRPEHPGEPRERAVSEEAARKVGLTLTYAPVASPADLDGALRTLAQERCDSLLVFPDGSMTAISPRVAQFAAERKIASVSGWDTFATNGFLLSYGPNLIDTYKNGLSRYVDRVLHGARPSDLPVELPKTVELVINMKTAKVLGVKIPNSVLLRADRVIE